MNESEWMGRGKTVAQLISELQSFEDQSLEVRISLDGGDSSVPISLVGNVEGRYAVLMNCQQRAQVANQDRLQEHNSGE